MKGIIEILSGPVLQRACAHHCNKLTEIYLIFSFFFSKSEKPQEFCITSFSAWWSCLYKTFPYILNHLLLLWQCLLDSIRFISSSKEHCSVEIAETAALCNFVIALIYSEFCFNTPAVKYKEGKTINIKAFSTLVFLRILFVGSVRK